MLVFGQVVTLHVHVEVSPHQHWDLPVVCPQGGHKVYELLHVGRPVPESGVIVSPVPRQSNKTRIDVLNTGQHHSKLGNDLLHFLCLGVVGGGNLYKERV